MTGFNEFPRTKDDLQRMIDGLIQESVHLDYKRSDSLSDKRRRGDISKDVSSFLNSDGGMIVYGVEETDHLPTAIDGGVPHAEFTREQLEQIILSNIAPRPDGIEVAQIELTSSHSAYAVRIPKGYKPYQDTQQSRYYKRYNFQSAPMEHYEIEDVRSRHFVIERLVNVDLAIRHGFLLYLVVSNPGAIQAEDVQFEIEPMIQWHGGQTPRLFERGARSLAPGREFHFLYDSFPEILGQGSTKTRVFAVHVRYRHPLVETPVDETFRFDLEDFLNSAVLEGDTVEMGKKLESVLKEISGGVKQLDGTLKKLSAIAAPTGLNLSHTALRNMLQVGRGESDFYADASRYLTVDILREVLEIDFRLAYRIHSILVGQDNTALESLEGITPAILDQLRKTFGVPDGAQ